ncbi:hypothetical protein VTK26DRAFT_8442 [Humicola hyalothermophila]
MFIKCSWPGKQRRDYEVVNKSILPAFSVHLVCAHQVRVTLMKLPGATTILPFWPSRQYEWSPSRPKLRWCLLSMHPQSVSREQRRCQGPRFTSQLAHARTLTWDCLGKQRKRISLHF